jgi:hypothetical protein
VEVALRSQNVEPWANLQDWPTPKFANTIFNLYLLHWTPQRLGPRRLD